MIVDFHAHTTASDGILAPAALVAAMDARGVERYAITDHDTLGAYAALPPGGGGRARLVPGIEINTAYKGNEVHVLGYAVPLDAPAFGALLERNRAARRDRAAAMVAKLADAGYPLALDRVEAEAAGAEAIGRPHVARALVRAGLVRDVQTCFDTLLGSGCPAFVPSGFVTPHEAIAAIREARGIPVLAHPGRLRDEAIVDELAGAGLLGLEVFHPAHKTSHVAYFRGRARELGLAMTAGSDFHDPRSATVGVEVERADLAPFLELLEDRAAA